MFFLFFAQQPHLQYLCSYAHLCAHHSSLHTYRRRGWEVREVNNISELSILMQWMHFDCQSTPTVSLLPRSLFWHTITHQYLQCLSSHLMHFGHVLLLFSCLQMSEHLFVTRVIHFGLLGFFDQLSVSSFPPPLSRRLLSPLKNFHAFTKQLSFRCHRQRLLWSLTSHCKHAKSRAYTDKRAHNLNTN